MTDDQVMSTIRNMLRVLGRQGPQLELVKDMTRRELSQGLLLSTRLHHLVGDVEEWLGHVSDRMLQDQANAET